MHQHERQQPINPHIDVMVASPMHIVFAKDISHEMSRSAKERKTGIANRSPQYLESKITTGRAIIALSSDNKIAGFCYIESWGHDKFVANSGLIVMPAFRRYGLAKRIKAAAFLLSRRLFPKARLFGLTTSLAVMKINSDLGYLPVTFSELTNDPDFWQGCSSCVNYEILQAKSRKNCFCTAMLFKPPQQAISPTHKANDHDHPKNHENHIISFT